MYYNPIDDIKVDKSNPVLWDIETSELYDVAFAIYIKEIQDMNKELTRKKEDKRCAYQPLSDFLRYKLNSSYIKKANIILRKGKINNIISNIKQ